ncbi:unnamed protein product [marine sediment metagenome]|uniref:Uncharacterized protein n=1 Tax=marine sediment metagenome TaxID=412755 RepID=X0UU46_9ZZZZ
MFLILAGGAGGVPFDQISSYCIVPDFTIYDVETLDDIQWNF